MSVTFSPSNAGQASPELNVANGNVTVVLDILGFAYGEENIYDGSIANADLKQYLKNVITADLSGMERAANHDGNMIYCGLGAERIKRYKELMGEIIAYCVAFDKDLTWG